ncbi:MAG: hypothetical protein J0H98_07075 [Solirubrobacterales bacterium]|nr:hypothetical protein [Solirubrobacterales bacterium]
MTSKKQASLDPDLAARFDQEFAELRQHWLTQLPEENRATLEEELRDDPFLTHQIFTLVTETLIPAQAGSFLQSAAEHVTVATPRERRFILAGLLGLPMPAVS